MQKKNGFSYMEVLVALALFIIVFLASLPLMLSIGQNIGAAERHGQKNLAATGIGLAVRDIINESGGITKSAIIGFANRFYVQNYSVFVLRPDGAHALGSPFHSGESGGSISIGGFSHFVKNNNSLVVVVLVRNDFDVVVGKSVQMAIDYDRNTGLMRRFYE